MNKKIKVSPNNNNNNKYHRNVNSIVFLGAGFDCYFGLPNWTKLLKYFEQYLISICTNSSKSLKRELKDISNNMKDSLIRQFFRMFLVAKSHHCICEKDINKFYEKFLDIKKYLDFHKKNNENIKKYKEVLENLKMKDSLIITTNFSNTLYTPPKKLHHLGRNNIFSKKVWKEFIENERSCEYFVPIHGLAFKEKNNNKLYFDINTSEFWTPVLFENDYLSDTYKKRMKVLREIIIQFIKKNPKHSNQIHIFGYSFNDQDILKKLNEVKNTLLKERRTLSFFFYLLHRNKNEESLLRSLFKCNAAHFKCIFIKDTKYEGLFHKLLNNLKDDIKSKKQWIKAHEKKEIFGNHNCYLFEPEKLIKFLLKIKDTKNLIAGLEHLFFLLKYYKVEENQQETIIKKLCKASFKHLNTKHKINAFLILEHFSLKKNYIVRAVFRKILDFKKDAFIQGLENFYSCHKNITLVNLIWVIDDFEIYKKYLKIFKDISILFRFCKKEEYIYFANKNINYNGFKNHLKKPEIFLSEWSKKLCNFFSNRETLKLILLFFLDMVNDSASKNKHPTLCPQFWHSPDEKEKVFLTILKTIKENLNYFKNALKNQELKNNDYTLNLEIEFFLYKAIYLIKHCSNCKLIIDKKVTTPYDLEKLYFINRQCLTWYADESDKIFNNRNRDWKIYHGIQEKISIKKQIVIKRIFYFGNKQDCEKVCPQSKESILSLINNFFNTSKWQTFNISINHFLHCILKFKKINVEHIFKHIKKEKKEFYELYGYVLECIASINSTFKMKVLVFLRKNKYAFLTNNLWQTLSLSEELKKDNIQIFLDCFTYQIDISRFLSIKYKVFYEDISIENNPKYEIIRFISFNILDEKPNSQKRYLKNYEFECFLKQSINKSKDLPELRGFLKSHKYFLFDITKKNKYQMTFSNKKETIYFVYFSNWVFYLYDEFQNWNNTFFFKKFLKYIMKNHLIYNASKWNNNFIILILKALTYLILNLKWKDLKKVLISLENILNNECLKRERKHFLSMLTLCLEEFKFFPQSPSYSNFIKSNFYTNAWTATVEFFADWCTEHFRFNTYNDASKFLIFLDPSPKTQIIYNVLPTHNAIKLHINGIWPVHKRSNIFTNSNFYSSIINNLLWLIKKPFITDFKNQSLKLKFLNISPENLYIYIYIWKKWNMNKEVLQWILNKLTKWNGLKEYDLVSSYKDTRWLDYIKKELTSDEFKLFKEYLKKLRIKISTKSKK